jgi:hypothetical protein
MKTINSSSPSQRWIALSLSALLLPGLGQLHLNSKKKGWALILLSLAALIITFGKFMMGVFQVSEKLHYPRPPDLAVLRILSQAFQAEKTWILAGLGLIVLIWVYGILDILWIQRSEN